jgi:hypothetical protein
VLFAVKNIQASRVNLLMNDFAAGLPSPLAFLGLGAAIAPALGAPRWKVAVLPVLHEVTTSTGRTKPEMTAGGGRFGPSEMPEDLHGSIRVSLLMDIPGCDSEQRLKEQLLGRRIAGGAIHNETIEVARVTPDGSALHALPRGYAVVPPDNPAKLVVATGAIDDLGALADVLFPAERALGSGRLVPVAVGHRLLEDPATASHRAGTRDATIPHVFTEPVVGAAELVSVRSQRLLSLSEEGLRLLLWRWTAEGEWIVGHPSYHPARRLAAASRTVQQSEETTHVEA